jgi:hypothetical protein
MILGFTGTSNGMRDLQLKAFIRELARYEPEEFHHGDCVGADEEAHAVADQTGWRVIIHPPIKSIMRAYCRGFALPEKDYLPRNHDIVEDTARMIATPYEPSEIQRSGTWATVRYARRIGRPVTIIWPDGSVSR